MPRLKACSGVILPAAKEAITRHFGDMPSSVFAEPNPWKCGFYHFTKKGGFVMRTVPENAWRDRLDSWLCHSSGAEIQDGTELIDFSEWNDRVELLLKHAGSQTRLSARFMVIASGGGTKFINRIDPMFSKTSFPQIRRVYCNQEYHRGSVDLDPDLYHVFLTPDMGMMPTLYWKDDVMVIDTIVEAGNRLAPVHQRYLGWLRDKHGFRSTGVVERLGCQAMAPFLANRFCFGTNRVLVAGEAAGFLNMSLEGISSAVLTGYIAGESCVAAAEAGSAGRIYYEKVKPERERTMREWSPPYLATGKSAPYMKESIKATPMLDRARGARDLFRLGRKLDARPMELVEVLARQIINRGFDFRA